MARCPRCSKHFRVPEDEPAETHGCPFCGFEQRDDMYIDDFEEMGCEDYAEEL